jgi:hypothetical protein
VARNIGYASMTGEEWWWSAAGGQRLHWSLDGGVTRLDARDRGVDIRWYTDKVLPGRPALQLEQRLALGYGWAEVGYEYERLDQNYLDRANTSSVARRDLHGVDARFGRRHWSICLELRNLTDERASDVAGFPLPGRSFFATTSFKR